MERRPSQEAPRPRVAARRADVAAALGALASTSVAVLVASLLLDLELHAGAAVGVAVVVAAVDAVVRPLLRPLAVIGGVTAALVLGVLAQVLAVLAALRLVAGHERPDARTAAVILVIVALVGSVIRWALAGTDHDYVVADLLARARRRSRATSDDQSREAGVVIVQLDGVPYSLVHRGIVSGDVPTLSRWVRSGTYEAGRWWARVPSTTPASQAGLLHGTSEGIPAFRWFDRRAGRVLVANRPPDAALIEDRVSDGRGLLSQGGVSIGNLFTGDAETSYLVVSRAGRHHGLGPGGAYLRFFASPFVLSRAVLLTAGEMIKELYQAHQQAARRVWPRTSRRGAYVVLRGLTNALLRHLTVGLVAEQMIRGTPVIFVNFVDYDEIAHHAGPARREALDAVTGLDQVLGTLEHLLPAAGRDYRFVVVSDHGQSQGATFRQLSGRSLDAVVRSLVEVGDAGWVSAMSDVEGWGPLNALISDVVSVARTASGRSERRHAGTPDGTDADLGPSGRDGSATDATGAPELVVGASGCLGLVWFPTRPGVDVDELRSDYPALLPGLLDEPGVGFVVVRSPRGPLAIGAAGVMALADGEVIGRDPLADFGVRARADLLRVASMAEAPDVLVHSTVDPFTAEVHAFEELVGSHGGLGGEQNDAVLVHPADWPIDVDLLDTTDAARPTMVGAEMVHRQLVRWLVRAGLRPDDSEVRVEGPPPAATLTSPARARSEGDRWS